MRIVTFNDLGTGHLLRKPHGSRTLCGRTYPGVLGELPDIGPFAAYPKHGHLHLCGNCERVVETGDVGFKQLGRRYRSTL